jgi:hypothetical protein
MGDAIFEPETELSRAMMVQILYNLEGRPAAPASGFEDVDESAWYAKAIGWAKANGVVAGMTETTFEPTATITREQMATMLYNYIKIQGQRLHRLCGCSTWSMFDKADISDYAYEAVCWMSMNG